MGRNKRGTVKKKCFNREINKGRRVIKENDKMRERVVKMRC